MTVCLLMVTASVMACDIDGKSGFMPENDLQIGVNDKSMRNNMTEERFNAIIDLADKHYAPIVKAAGGKLKWNRAWKTKTVNASAQRGWFGSWKVNMYGGLARHRLVTDDGFALVVCHELGHHLGGAPKVGGLTAWASNEGQSDYFASLKCFRRMYEGENNVELVAAMDVPAIVTTKCEESYTLENDVALCVRASMAGKSLADLLGSLRSSPATDFETPDSSIATSTNNAHPAAQCRLDTYFQGALCNKTIEETVSNEDATEGTCNRIENMDTGVRPLCWFKPAAL